MPTQLWRSINWLTAVQQHAVACLRSVMSVLEPTDVLVPMQPRDQLIVMVLRIGLSAH